MSEKKEIVRYVDRSQITAVKFKFPALMSDNADKMVRECHETFLDAQNALYDARDKVRECEVKFEEAKAKWTAIQNIADIEFSTIEKEIETTRANTMVFKGVGNSTLGYDTRTK